MKLSIKKDQDRGLGGIKFIIDAKVELTNVENTLVTKYKVNKNFLFNKNNYMNTEIL